MPGVCVDGMDVTAIREVTLEAVALARDGGGPTLIEAKTYRFTGHSKSDGKTTLYRPAEEEEEWKARDPIPNFRRALLESGFAADENILEIEQQVESQVAEAVEFALSSPVEDMTKALEGVYASNGTQI